MKPKRCPMVNEHCDGEFCNGTKELFQQMNCEIAIPEILTEKELGKEWKEWVLYVEKGGDA